LTPLPINISVDPPGLQLVEKPGSIIEHRKAANLSPISKQTDIYLSALAEFVLAAAE